MRSVEKLKVFHGLVNYGTQAGFFAKGLREENVEAISVVGFDRFKRLADIELTYDGNILQRTLKYIWHFCRKIYWFFTFNTFHFYYGTSLFPRQLDLPLYRMLGKKVIMHYLGNDVQGYQQSVEKYKWNNMVGFMENNDPVAYDEGIKRRLRFESKYLDLQFVCAPHYSEFVSDSKVMPLAIDISSYHYVEHPQHEILEILHAPTHRAYKGSDYIIAAIEKLIEEGEPVKLSIAEGLTHDQLKEEYKKCDIFIDQVMAGWYGTAALEAMAIGRPVICSIRSIFFQHIDYGEKIPIIHADPDCIYDSIKYLIRNRDKLPEIGRTSRIFVEDVHDYRKLTKELIGYYEKL